LWGVENISYLFSPGGIDVAFNATCLLGTEWN
jgi:hypothetical protein